MTSRPVTADARSTVRAVMHKLLDLDVRHLPIVDEGDLVGIISDRDLRDVTARLVAEGDSQGARTLDRPVADVMSSDVLFVDPETEVDEVIEMMLENKIGAVPVVSPGTRELVGIVSYMDVLRAAQGEV